MRRKHAEASAMYYVMTRGDRREAIVKDDEDRKMFNRMLEEAAKETGMRILSYALMSKYYRLLLEALKTNSSSLAST